MIYNQFKWFLGVVEDRNDPLKLGRVRVRCLGYHTEQKSTVRTDQLPWAQVAQDPTDVSSSGIGKSPNGLLEGTHVVGVFLDPQLQMPMVLGAFSGLIAKGATPTNGFNDSRLDPTGAPNEPASVSAATDGSGVTVTNQDGVNYPKTKYIGYTDTNWLATGENTANTIVQTKTDLRLTAIPTVGGTFDEPLTPYAAQYPYNRVYASESGHVIEVDDTPGAERIALYHRSGAFDEIHPQGDRVSKTTGRRVQIVYENDDEYVMGEKKVTVQKGKKLVVNSESGSGAFEVEVGTGGNFEITVLGGDIIQNVTGNVTQTISGNVTTTATTGNVSVSAPAGAITVTAPTIGLTGTVTVTGALTVTGAAALQGGLAVTGGSGATVTGNISILGGGDITAGTITLKTHVHTEQGDGADVSAPKAPGP